MRAQPNRYEQELLDGFRLVAPPNGAAFHEPEDLQLFLENPHELYMPGPLVVSNLCNLDAVATLSGPFGVGKNGAKEAAVAQAELPHPRHNIPPIHSVLNGTTRLNGSNVPGPLSMPTRSVYSASVSSLGPLPK